MSGIVRGSLNASYLGNLIVQSGIVGRITSPSSPRLQVCPRYEGNSGASAVRRSIRTAAKTTGLSLGRDTGVDWRCSRRA